MQTSTLSLQGDCSDTVALLQHIFGKLKLYTIIEHLTFFYFPFQQKLPLYADFASQMNSKKKPPKQNQVLTIQKY